MSRTLEGHLRAHATGPNRAALDAWLDFYEYNQDRPAPIYGSTGLYASLGLAVLTLIAAIAVGGGDALNAWMVVAFGATATLVLAVALAGAIIDFRERREMHSRRVHVRCVVAESRRILRDAERRRR